MSFQAPKGTYDIVPPASSAWLAVREALALPPRLSGYDYVETPMFEDTALFVRGVGESTDVVNKEMYTFDDRGGRSLTLRPEGTAGVLRAVVERGLHRGQLPVKVWYVGPNFRYEQPQSGRYRQHTQVGVETIGSDDPALDAEVIWLAVEAHRRIGLTKVRLLLNSLGCRDCRPAYRELLQDFLRGLDLDEDTRRRVEINPMRVLDDKRAEVQAQLTNAPLITDHLCGACKEHHDEVRAYLSDLGVHWEDNPRLVRGMDYYVRTTFEFVHDGLGAQSSIGGGGRYDGLMATIGGPDLGGVGFGLGLDRTILAVEAEGLTVGDRSRCDVYVVPLGAAARRRTVTLLRDLRQAGVRSDTAYGGQGLKGAMKAADRSGAAFAVVLGDRDLEQQTAQVKDLRSGDQQAVPLDEVVQRLVQAVQTQTTKENPG
ncbi:histidine--tRNA ligase [Actinopolymorpha alba]|uniref:histidine--tRNA ligase n=1 Tax=Actinopolymorpha alba TaxID=533267 RepID=UPI000382EFEC|nr:histidine--tRNA ligase [Actinopolymorpha alba]